MPHDQAEVVVSSSLSACHNMVNQSLLFSAGLNTKHPRGIHSSYWFHLEPGGQGKRKDTRGRVKSAFSPLTESHMDLRSHPGALVGSSLHLTLCVRADYQGSRQGSGSKHTPKQQHTAFIHTWYPDGARLARAGNDTQLEESCIGGITQMYWGISGSCPLM